MSKYNKEKAAAYQKKHRAEQRLNKLCYFCSIPLGEEDKTLICLKCKLKYPSIPRSTIKYYRDRRDYFRIEGKCLRCGDETINGKNSCLKHYLQSISSSRLKTNKLWNELKELMISQNYKCPLTGEDIEFGNNIELDHIVPTSRGGTNDLSNVRWVVKWANRLKRDFLDSEMKEKFLKIISNIDP